MKSAKPIVKGFILGIAIVFFLAAYILIGSYLDKTIGASEFVESLLIIGFAASIASFLMCFVYWQLPIKK